MSDQSESYIWIVRPIRGGEGHILCSHDRNIDIFRGPVSAPVCQALTYNLGP